MRAPNRPPAAYVAERDADRALCRTGARRLRPQRRGGARRTAGGPWAGPGRCFGEMFSRVRIPARSPGRPGGRLRAGGFMLLDAQFLTAHLERFGAVEINRTAYLRRLRGSTRDAASRWATIRCSQAPPRRPGVAGAAEDRAPAARRIRSARHRRPGARARERRAGGEHPARERGFRGGAIDDLDFQEHARSGGSVGGVVRQARAVIRSVP